MSQYDLLIVNGEVIIPATGFRGALDVAIANGRIVATEPDIDREEAAQIVDATGKFVVPGLIDLHTHLGFELHTKVVAPDDVCPSSGVTTAVDMGSTGAFTFPWYRERVLERATTRLFEFINIASIGTIAIHTPYYVSSYGRYIDTQDTLHTIERNREYIRGIKVFASSDMVGDSALEAVRAAKQVAGVAGLPVAVHVSRHPPPLEAILDLLDRGDILTHTYTPHSQGILDHHGRIRIAVREARDRGVVFDLGHGAGSFSFQVAKMALDQGFPPDTISTDLYYANIVTPVIDLPTTMSKFLNLGLSLDEAIARTTWNPARALGEECLGTLEPGSAADVALLALREGQFTYVDCQQRTLQGEWKLECETTICRGKIVYQTEGGSK